MTDWQAFYQASIARIDTQLSQRLAQLPEVAPKLKAAMQHGVLLGGKRLRPFLLYATAEALGAEDADMDPCAIALELVHAFSLIHDDLPAMDDDELRRGHPTCHIAFDEATAILAGDALQSLAIETLVEAEFSAKVDVLHLVKVLSKATGYQGLCGGQSMDLEATNQHIDQPALETLHQHKTGALITAAVEMGYVLSGNQNPETQKQLLEFATAIGLAFQVHDDVLDVTSDTQTLGKPQGSDIANNKSTYPALLGLDGARALATELHGKALHALESLPYNTAILRGFADYTIQREF